MRKLTETQFLDLQLNAFVKSVSVTNSEFTRHEDSIHEVGDNHCFESWQAGYCVLSHDDIELEFAWKATGGQNSYASAFEFDVKVDSAFELRGFVLVDDDGEELGKYEREELLSEFLDGGEWVAHVKNRLPIAEIEELEMSDSNEMSEYVVERDNDRAIKFKGELIANVASSDNQAMGSSYSGSTGRWKELTLYKTLGGKFICEKVERTRWQGERDRYSGAVCDNVEDVILFFGTGWLAKDLYHVAKLDSALHVE